MINHNIALYALLDRTLTINAFGGDWVANYTEGDLFELSKKLADSKTKYPIIWLQSGYRVDRAEGVSTLRGCRMFLITYGDSHDRYAKRYGSTYDEMLYPLLEGIKKVMAKSRGFKMNNDFSFTTFPFNDTAELNLKSAQKSQHTVTGDVWDALLLEVDISVEDCAFDMVYEVQTKDKLTYKIN